MTNAEPQADSAPHDSTTAEFWRPPAPSRATRKFPRQLKGGAGRVGLVGGAFPREIHCESILEGKAAMVFLARRDVTDLWEQPPAVEYVDSDGCVHQHTFDFLVTLRDGRKMAVAVKYHEQAEKHGVAEMLKLIARQVGTACADLYLLVTDRHLGADRVHDAKLILWSRRIVSPEADARLRSLCTDLNGRTIIEALVEASGLEGDGFTAVIHLIDEGFLRVVSAGRIDYPTMVARDLSIAGGAP